VPFVELDALNWEPGCLTSTARYKREDDIPLGRLRGSPPGPGGVASHVLTVCRGLRPWSAVRRSFPFETSPT